MLSALLRGTDWSKVADYLSPVLFQIVPPLSMAKQVQTLVAGYRNKAQFVDLKTTLGRQLAETNWAIDLAPQGEGSSEGQDVRGSTLPLGDRVLRLYFWQILSQDTAILDLRTKAWTERSPGVFGWDPAPLMITWDPDFLTAVRAMYRGFYQGDDALLDRGLEAIGLKPGKAVLLKHFGADQAKVAFDLAHFRSSFHDIFVACKDAKTRLHPNVLGLGAVLACLYEHLQSLGEAFDVRSAFHDADQYALTREAKSPQSRLASK